MTRRARKGFSLKYNPDSHWSAAFYKGLNSIQLKDGVDVCVINRDDAAGFRLDTLTTSKQCSTPSVKGSDILTTRTDYVNKINIRPHYKPHLTILQLQKPLVRFVLV